MNLLNFFFVTSPQEMLAELAKDFVPACQGEWGFTKLKSQANFCQARTYLITPKHETHEGMLVLICTERCEDKIFVF